jgi:hypothetical protein
MDDEEIFAPEPCITIPVVVQWWRILAEVSDKNN